MKNGAPLVFVAPFAARTAFSTCMVRCDRMIQHQHFLQVRTYVLPQDVGRTVPAWRHIHQDAQINRLEFLATTDKITLSPPELHAAEEVARPGYLE
jgi:hypothetical protein